MICFCGTFSQTFPCTERFRFYISLAEFELCSAKEILCPWFPASNVIRNSKVLEKKRLNSTLYVQQAKNAPQQ